MADRSPSSRRRRLTTPWHVKFVDAAARSLITIGGIGTIVAVSTVFVFLCFVVAPLFTGASVEQVARQEVAWSDENLARVAIDEYQVLGWTLSESGTLATFRADNGQVLSRRELFPGSRLTATSFSAMTPGVAAGFADGTIREGRVAVRAELVDAARQMPEVRAMLRKLKVGQIARYNGGVVQRLEPNRFRRHWIEAEFGPPLRLATTPIRLVDHLDSGQRNVICALTADGKLLYTTVRRIEAIDGTVKLKPAQKVELHYPMPTGASPFRLRLLGRGDAILLAWDSGLGQRFDVRDVGAASLAEEVRIVPARHAKLTALELLLGGTTVVCGDSTGGIHAWFPVRQEPSTTADGLQLTRAHDLQASGSAVNSLAVSARSRMVMAGLADGGVRLFHVTTGRQLVEASAEGGAPVVGVAIAPKDDGLLAATRGGMWRCRLDLAHAGASVASLFLPVWYEGYARPQHTWQSTGGTDDFEPKLGLWPLVFGTLKATGYSLLFGAPLALLAALYTSEFMSPRLKAKVKPTVELMASLPSVVLGFLAGNVIAKAAEDKIPHLLTALVTVPLVVLLGSYLWQQLPRRIALRHVNLRLPLIALAALPLGLLLAAAIGRLVERWLFGGDMMLWLDGQVGNALGAWLLLLIPLAALATAFLLGWYVNPWLRARSADFGHARLAACNLAKFALAALGAGLAALACGGLLTAVGLDPRGSLGDTWLVGSFADTFVQRNALVVGFIMGFAIIPIIYTIAEDALSTVPEHLRSASLGAGATPWQTAVRVVVPTAMSGLFSALMVGLGRAVGETMIVLMAAGNTPVLDLNLFNGFRTLSANIAVEMPEAVRDSTHYRVLFLAALVLFVMTFCVNTVAEIVRLRFRRRAYQL